MSASADWRIVYDGECGFCRWSLAWVLRWDRRGRLVPVALADPDAGSLLAAIDPSERPGSWHLVDPAGRVHSAGAAGLALLPLLPAGGPLARVLARTPEVVERAYRWIADRRGRLGRLVRPRALARADARIAARKVPPETDGRTTVSP